MGILAATAARHATKERIMENHSTPAVPPHARQRPGDPPQGEYMTISELANWLKISRGNAWTLLMTRGDIPYVRISDRTLRISRTDVEAYIARCRSDFTG